MIVTCTPLRYSVLLAVLHQERPTQQSVAAEVGAASSTVHYHLQALKALGIIAAEPGLRGTLRPLVEYQEVGQS
jgi:predicted transcriptional regulator